MTAEYLPCADAEPCKKRLPFPCAKIRVGINRSHKYRRVTVILRLTCRHIFHIHKNVAAEYDFVLIIYKHRFAEQMSAASRIKFKLKISEIKKAHTGKHVFALRIAADRHDF